MALPALLFVIPLLTAVILLINHNASLRNGLVKGSAALIMVLSVAIGVLYFGKPLKIGIEGTWMRLLMTSIDGLVVLAVLYYSSKFKRYSIGFLGLLQFVIISAFEYHMGERIYTSWDFIIDNFAIIMILIAGIIGGLIAVYSLGYMAMYHRNHTGMADRRSFFFFVVFCPVF